MQFTLQNSLPFARSISRVCSWYQSATTKGRRNLLSHNASSTLRWRVGLQFPLLSQLCKNVSAAATKQQLPTFEAQQSIGQNAVETFQVESTDIFLRIGAQLSNSASAPRDPSQSINRETYTLQKKSKGCPRGPEDAGRETKQQPYSLQCPSGKLISAF